MESWLMMSHFYVSVTASSHIFDGTCTRGLTSFLNISRICSMGFKSGLFASRRKTQIFIFSRDRWTNDAVSGLILSSGNMNVLTTKSQKLIHISEVCHLQTFVPLQSLSSIYATLCGFPTYAKRHHNIATSKRNPWIMLQGARRSLVSLHNC